MQKIKGKQSDFNGVLIHSLESKVVDALISRKEVLEDKRKINKKRIPVRLRSQHTAVKQWEDSNRQ